MRFSFPRPREAVLPVANAKPGQWPRCGMATHGVNTAQAIKSAAVLYRFDAHLWFAIATATPAVFRGGRFSRFPVGGERVSLEFRMKTSCANRCSL